MYVVAGIIVLIVVVVAALVLAKPKQAADVIKTNGSTISMKPILTPNEIEFFNRLQRALPDYHIFAQVAFGAILKATSGDGWSANRGRFSQKIADYVVCAQETMKIIAVIELDDKTHKSDKDAKRDEMLENAGYRTIRFESKAKPSESEIASLFAPQEAPPVPKLEQF